MYTQCPDCLTAFRVTAGLLQQASGRVRCGSCGHAFSALEHLSEDPPPLDDAVEGGQGGSDEDPDALLDTFTDVSFDPEFDDVRIEDTGVEWRVIDDEEANESPAGEDGQSAASGSFRWFLTDEDAETPADEGPLPEVHDEVAVAEDGGILVEESGIRGPQEPLDLARTDSAEPRYDDNTPLPEDFDAAASAEPEVPRRRATDHIEPRSPEFDERQADLELGAPEDWRELLDEFGGEGRPDRAIAPPAEPVGDVPSDIDTQFGLKALEMGIDVTGDGRIDGRIMADASPASEESDEAEEDETVDFDLEAAADGPAVDFDPGVTGPSDIDFDVRGDGEADRQPVDFDPGDERPDETEFELVSAFEAAGAAGHDEEREDREREAALEVELDTAYSQEEESSTAASDRDTAFDVPPQTEEEMTINLQIDQDLMRLAAEEGFSSTLAGERKMPEDSLLVETIVMEGDFVKSALDKDLGAVIEPVVGPLVETEDGRDDDPTLLLDTTVKSKERIRGGRRRTDPPSYTVIAGVVVLAALLLAQVVHAYRDSLATYGAFNRTLGTVYRLFGEPLIPQWDVKGWRFESTAGSTDAADQILTIRSRISNQSGGALPYPLLHVALTDRFEEVIGSRVLEPADYLDDGEDPATPVASGSEFSATITIEALSSDATGFKLNVCYREDAAALRCATEAFR